MARKIERCEISFSAKMFVWCWRIHFPGGGSLGGTGFGSPLDATNDMITTLRQYQ